nr:uncharacterized protein LOC110370644 [Helicoverpa armigera]
MHSMSVDQRRTLVKDLCLCTNCLRPGHDNVNCKSKWSCYICNERHNTLLHIERQSKETQAGDSKVTVRAGSSTTLTCSSTTAEPFKSTKILGTAVVRLRHSDGSMQYARALIDSGSMDSLITNECARRLGLRIKKCNLTVSGLGQRFVNTMGHTVGSIIPRLSESPQFDISLVVLPKIAGMMPSSSLPMYVKNHFAHLDLADCDFDKSGPIDLLLGVECFDQIYTGSRYTPGPGLPCALSSVLGWVITGQFLHNTSTRTPDHPVTSLVASSSALDDTVQRFWESEEPSKCKISGPEDEVHEVCEQIYESGTYGTPEDKYVVPLMLKDHTSSLGDSCRHVSNRFLNLEKRLCTRPEFETEYQDSMEQYKDLGHMQPIDSLSTAQYLIPHHCVGRPESTTTRLRVVFDVSSRTTNNYTLINIVHVGPKLQIDIVDLVTKFRLYKIVLTADVSPVCKMQRQILIRPEDRCFQHILWRDSPTEALIENELNIVAYEVTSSPYLSWDDALSQHLAKQWHLPAANLLSFKNIILPWLVIPPDLIDICLVGFCDGSLNGYRCCVYSCAVTCTNSTVTHLLIGKSRVAPLKPPIINRLELSAAVLLALHDLVIVNEPNLPPLLWRLARIEQVHPGANNVVRVFTLRAANGKTLRQPVVKLCSLPIN